MLYALFCKEILKDSAVDLVIIAAFALVYLAVTSPNGDIIGGWSVDPEQLRIGFTRVMYPFFCRLIIIPYRKLVDVKHAFLV